MLSPYALPLNHNRSKIKFLVEYFKIIWSFVLDALISSSVPPHPKIRNKNFSRRAARECLGVQALGLVQHFVHPVFLGHGCLYTSGRPIGQWGLKCIRPAKYTLHIWQKAFPEPSTSFLYSLKPVSSFLAGVPRSVCVDVIPVVAEYPAAIPKD
jgi:hypothetical protein